MAASTCTDAGRKDSGPADPGPKMSRRYPRHPMVGCGVIVWKGRRVLLVRRGAPPRVGEWSLPGGGQELGEKIRETAAREVLEETGCAARIETLVDVVDTVIRDGEGRIEYQYTLVDFDGVWLSGDPVAGEDAADATWADVDDLDRFSLWRETVRVIRLSATRRGLLRE